jgi:hypothetical protein
MAYGYHFLLLERIVARQLLKCRLPLVRRKSLKYVRVSRGSNGPESSAQFSLVW